MALSISNANETSTLSTGPAQSAGTAANLVTASGFDNFTVDTTNHKLIIKNGSTTVGNITYSTS